MKALLYWGAIVGTLSAVAFFFALVVKTDAMYVALVSVLCAVVIRVITAR